ncbi:MAG: hypothetical protein O2968_15785 [Acidobacteria bacterium]|nr:hypothetical protein [Acidobacteriota bacterium]
MPSDDAQPVEPIRQSRQEWKQAFAQMHEAGDDEPILDGPTTEFDEEEWAW